MSMRVLVIEDESILARSIQVYLARQGYEVDLAENAEAGISAYQSISPDITIIDYQLGEIDGLEVLREIRRFDKEAQIVMMTGHGNIKLAVNAMKAGARDFLTKPVPLVTLKESIKQLTSKTPMASDRKQPENPLDAILGRSMAVHELKQSVLQIISNLENTCETPPPVLITGESGTGKELIAKALQTNGPRKKKAFIMVDCAAQSEEEIDRSIFGSFPSKKTPANDEPGPLHSAAGGIILLDEISKLSRPLQAKLLRLLEDHSSQDSAVDDEWKYDIWFLSSTNVPLAALTQSGAFNKALLFRLQTVVIEAPPLRYRDSDMLFLAEYFIETFSMRHGLPRRRLTPDARAKIVDYSWPGNIRELQNVIEGACLQAKGDRIEEQNINFPAQEPPAERPFEAVLDEGMPLEAIEKHLVAEALRRTRWNVSKAATLLGISRDQMRYRIQKFKLKF